MHRLQDPGRDPREAAPLTPYVGRFAPSPTGPLHFGSLLAAAGSYLEARSRGGSWLVRMEDLDPPREVPGAASLILSALDRYGFEWDGEVLFQSTRGDAYQAALDRLQASGLTYRCTCSRRQIAQAARLQGIEGPIYPGTCLATPPQSPGPAAIRLRVGAEVVSFVDGLAGPQRQDLAHEAGDFVLRRRDGLFAYQLAVTVDDIAQGITHIVRGRDLLDSTPRQVYLRRLLGAADAEFVHLPIAVSVAGDKLSKQTGALPLDTARPAPTLWRALRALGHFPPAELTHSLSELWDWAHANWSLDRVQNLERIPVGPGGQTLGPPYQA